MTLLLQGRTVLVTGAAGRLGRRLVVGLIAEGAAVAQIDLEVTAADGVAAFAADISVEAEVERAVAAAESAIGSVDGLVNCAGFVPNRPLLEMDVDEWDRVFAVNVRGTMLTTKACARRWVGRGTRGAIVNLSSIAATSARAGGAHYCSSKAAVSMLTKVSAAELGPHGIRVNAIAPGLVLDEVITEARPGTNRYVAAMLAATPLGRTGSPDEVADTIAFLLSERSRYTTGAIVEVTGGAHVGRTHMPLSGAM
jgi:NAD(P)-dependent dehydrogenase (short-subunit alcohol dehydrogenase family)